jgi:hypothetical protein
VAGDAQRDIGVGIVEPGSDELCGLGFNRNEIVWPSSETWAGKRLKNAGWKVKHLSCTQVSTSASSRRGQAARHYPSAAVRTWREWTSWGGAPQCH